jgi:hypothetical protein
MVVGGETKEEEPRVPKRPVRGPVPEAVAGRKPPLPLDDAPADCGGLQT